MPVLTAARLNRPPTMAEIKALMDKVATLPPVELPVKHHRSDGTYVREIFMPAGTLVVGKEHATRHLNVLVSGRCTIWTVHGRMDLEAPATFESMSGVRKVVYMHTDVIFMTVHPTEFLSEDDVEGKLIRPAEQGLLFPELEHELLVGESKCPSEPLQALLLV